MRKRKALHIEAELLLPYGDITVNLEKGEALAPKEESALSINYEHRFKDGTKIEPSEAKLKYPIWPEHLKWSQFDPNINIGVTILYKNIEGKAFLTEMIMDSKGIKFINTEDMSDFKY